MIDFSEGTNVGFKDRLFEGKDDGEPLGSPDGILLRIVEGKELGTSLGT